jgi:hypothetical protein
MAATLPQQPGLIRRQGFYKNSDHQIGFGNDSDKVFVAGYKKRPDSIGINFFGGIFHVFILLYA